MPLPFEMFCCGERIHPSRHHDKAVAINSRSTIQLPLWESLSPIHLDPSGMNPGGKLLKLVYYYHWGVLSN